LHQCRTGGLPGADVTADGTWDHDFEPKFKRQSMEWRLVTYTRSRRRRKKKFKSVIWKSHVYIVLG
jgi:hypothetical protein